MCLFHREGVKYEATKKQNEQKKKRDVVCTKVRNAGTPQLKMQMPRNSYAPAYRQLFFFLSPGLPPVEFF
jgi:hypothetical protein